MMNTQCLLYEHQRLHHTLSHKRVSPGKFKIGHCHPYLHNTYTYAYGVENFRICDNTARQQITRYVGRSNCNDASFFTVKKEQTKTQTMVFVGQNGAGTTACCGKNDTILRLSSPNIGRCTVSYISFVSLMDS